MKEITRKIETFPRQEKLKMAKKATRLAT